MPETDFFQGGNMILTNYKNIRYSMEAASDLAGAPKFRQRYPM